MEKFVTGCFDPLPGAFFGSNCGRPPNSTIHSGQGSHYPPLDESWPDLIKLQWRAAAVQYHTGKNIDIRLDVWVRGEDVHFGYVVSYPGCRLRVGLEYEWVSGYLRALETYWPTVRQWDEWTNRDLSAFSDHDDDSQT